MIFRILQDLYKRLHIIDKLDAGSGVFLILIPLFKVKVSLLLIFRQNIGCLFDYVFKNLFIESLNAIGNMITNINFEGLKC